MDMKGFVQLVVFSVILTALGMFLCIWLMKKAGIPLSGMGYYKKLFYDNYSGIKDSRTGHHRSYSYSKKGSKQSIEITCTRGTLLLEFYTEDGQVLQSWRNGDPAIMTVELPPKKRVYQRMHMEHFSGSITFLKR